MMEKTERDRVMILDLAGLRENKIHPEIVMDSPTATEGEKLTKSKSMLPLAMLP